MSNVTRERLNDSPFKSASEESKFINRVKTSELEKLIRSQTRLEFFKSNESMLEPFRKGQKVEFSITKLNSSTIHTFLNDENIVVHTIDSSLKADDSALIVKSLIEAVGGIFTKSYLETLNLIDSNTALSENK